MSLNLKNGKIPLKLLLLLSISGFLLVKTISDYQSNVIASLQDRYDTQSYPLSKHIDTPNKWQTYSAKGYTIKYPPVWRKTDSLSRAIGNNFEAKLGNKVKLEVELVKSPKVQDTTKKLTAGSNQFYMVEDSGQIKSAVAHNKNSYYKITLSQSNYFENSRVFGQIYFEILKSFSTY